MSQLFNRVKKFVRESFGSNERVLHFDRTVYWLKQLKPDADEALLIAGMGHDLERAFRKDKDKLKKVKFTDEEFLKEHQEKSAKILAKFLEEHNADKELIKRVKYLVSKHEFGGDQDQNLLKDADSISFFETNASRFLKRLQELGYEKIKEKFDWMYDRISDVKAKEIAQPFYKQALDDLKSEKNDISRSY